MKNNLSSLFRATAIAIVVALTASAARATPAMVVQVIETDHVDDYLALLSKANAHVKSVTGIEQLRHAWTGDFSGQDAHGLVVVSMFDSAAAAIATQEKLAKDPGTKEILADFAKIRKLGPAYLMKGVRFEGLYPGGAVFNTSIVTADEAAYLKALDGLKAIFDANGFKDAKLNCFRQSAGRENSTHLVVICLPNQMRVAELIDAITDTPIMREWNASVANIRTTIHNGTYHEVTK